MGVKIHPSFGCGSPNVSLHTYKLALAYEDLIVFVISILSLSLSLSLFADSENTTGDFRYGLHPNLLPLTCLVGGRRGAYLDYESEPQQLILTRPDNKRAVAQKHRNAGVSKKRTGDCSFLKSRYGERKKGNPVRLLPISVWGSLEM